MECASSWLSLSVGLGAGLWVYMKRYRSPRLQSTRPKQVVTLLKRLENQRDTDLVHEDSDGHTNLVALVTGGTRGIGMAITKALASLPQFDLVIFTGRDDTYGNRVEKELKAALNEQVQGRACAKVKFQQLDVEDDESLNHCIDRVRSLYGSVDVLINNAGLLLERNLSVQESSHSIIRRLHEVAVIGSLRLIQAFLPEMKARGYGRIVNLSSSLSIMHKIGCRGLAYRLSKMGVNGLTTVLAAELAEEQQKIIFSGNLKKPPNILVNCMCPGFVMTRMTEGRGATKTTKDAAKTAVWLATVRGHFIQPGHLANSKDQRNDFGPVEGVWYPSGLYFEEGQLIKHW